MGKLIQFDPRRGRRNPKWTRASDYGVPPPGRPPRGPGGPRNPKKTWRQAFAEMRPFLLLIGLITVIVVVGDGGAFEPPAFLQTRPEKVQGDFTRCGPGRGAFCVIDGDTFKLGARNVRVVGIDTAEVRAQCPAEVVQAEISTAALQRWLNRGPFQMTARIDDPQDRYGRDLRIVKRIGADGKEDRLADFMRAEGGARSYLDGYRDGWCD